MTTLSETAYPRLKANLSLKELRDIYTPTEAEVAFANQVAQRPLARFAVLIHLKLFQRLGFFTLLRDVPEPIKRHIAQAFGLLKMPPAEQLNDYDTSGSKRVHVAALRQYLNVRVIDDAGKTWLRSVAEEAAETKNTVPDIINVMLEELVRHRYELPGFTVLQRMAHSARDSINNEYFVRITEALTPSAKVLIDELLKTPSGSTYSGWHTLKREPKKPTSKEVRGYLQHIRQMKQLAEQLPLIEIPVPKLRHFRYMARALNAAEVAELKPAKRYALATIFIRSQYSQTLDDAADLFVRLMQKMENTAQQQLIAHQLEHAKRADMLIGQLKDLLDGFRLEGTDTQRIDAITHSLIMDPELLLADCEAHMAFAGRNHLPFLIRPYQKNRSLLLNCLEIMALRSTSQDASMEKLIEVLFLLRSSKSQQTELSALGITLDDCAWLTGHWRKLVLVKPVSGPVTKVDRKYFELAVLSQIKDEIRSGDLYIADSERYDDYREQLVSEEVFLEELADYANVTGIEADPEVFVAALKKQLATLSNEIDHNFPENTSADIVDGRLVLKRATRTEINATVAALDEAISDALQNISIVDALIDATRWLDLHKHFRPLAGTESRLEDPMMRFVTTLFCYGCNLGPVQTAHSIKSFNRRQISWLNLKYVNEELLDRAIVEVINAYNKFELPGYWGSGETASADGTKWSVYEENLLSEYHIRYGGYGGIGYYHVSDKYIALFSRFIPCGVYEGVYILDGFWENQSDIKPNTVHGDTQAQSYPIFALSHLLGISLMPRIRGVQDLTLFRPDNTTRYENIDCLFGEPIDWKLIETHLPDMLRVAVSIKVGKITPSTILRRLGNFSRKNKMYVAFKELGKAIRTQFLLRYISDVEFRKTISAATNKSEQFNEFVKWVFFGGQGVIAENIRHEQRKLIKYSHLVANMLILHNVVGMTEALAKMKQSGADLKPDILGGLAPFRHRHINRFGDYTLDFERELRPLNFEMRIL
ncbi:Tn3 family transposase [Chitinolyticbacter meiyuanensis]|uniref:Tn3 family transposase n=1 Tax=Chitinolyticbacter meiyuanensis TaxID=682798 RepID=UPI0011E5F141|nr:Tn3 family transposase [Chitinolyticbacter meiyuanensis]